MSSFQNSRQHKTPAWVLLVTTLSLRQTTIRDHGVITNFSKKKKRRKDISNSLGALNHVPLQIVSHWQRRPLSTIDLPGNLSKLNGAKNRRRQWNRRNSQRSQPTSAHAELRSTREIIVVSSRIVISLDGNYTNFIFFKVWSSYSVKRKQDNDFNWCLRILNVSTPA